MTGRPKNSFKRILVISNPASTNAKRLKRRTGELGRLLAETGEIINIKTSSNGRVANKKLILANKELLGPDTLLCIAAGDGTVNIVVETLVSEPDLSPKMRKTPVLPLWGGNANDLAHMLNGYSLFAGLKTIFDNGKVIEVNPLQVNLTNGNKKVLRIAACYASFGATAYAAHSINNPSRRKAKLRSIRGLRLLTEAQTVVRAFMDVPMFKVKENGSVSNIYEYALINGSRIAKVERLPLRLTDNGFYLAKIYRKHPVVILYILQILRRRKFGRVTSNRSSFMLLEPTWLQLDGEVIKVEKNTKVEIEPCNQPFYALSKRLR